MAAETLFPIRCFGEDSGDASFLKLNQIIEYADLEYREGRRLQGHIRKVNGDIIGYVDGTLIKVPKKFVEYTLAHIKQIIESGAATSASSKDLYHGHLFVDEKVFTDQDLEYPVMIEKVLNLFLYKMSVLYHASEFLSVGGKEEIDYKSSVALMEKRNIFFRYGCGKMKILEPHEDGTGVMLDEKDGLSGVGLFHFLANMNGEFVVNINGIYVRIDISFDTNQPQVN